MCNHMLLGLPTIQLFIHIFGSASQRFPKQPAYFLEQLNLNGASSNAACLQTPNDISVHCWIIFPYSSQLSTELFQSPRRSILNVHQAPTFSLHHQLPRDVTDWTITISACMWLHPDIQRERERTLFSNVKYTSLFPGSIQQSHINRESLLSLYISQWLNTHTVPSWGAFDKLFYIRIRGQHLANKMIRQNQV